MNLAHSTPSGASPIFKPNIALVLSGGGARGAYQAGVVKGIQTILGLGVGDLPFQIFTGTSAGAINAAFFAAAGADFSKGVDECYSLWSNITPESIVQTDLLALTRLSGTWIKSLSIGTFANQIPANFLLNTAPLVALLSKSLKIQEIAKNIEQGLIRGFACSAIDYEKGTSVTFFDGHPDIEQWSRPTRLGVRGRITLAKILASSSIPLLFPPVKIHGSHYGDGGVRLQAPLSPAIHLGADKILAIGIMQHPTEKAFLARSEAHQNRYVSVADIAGVLLNAAFMELLDSDVERHQQINHMIGLRKSNKTELNGFREIPLLAIHPSQNLSQLAGAEFHRFPWLLRHLMRGLGISEHHGLDLLSYISFHKAFSQTLLDIGFQDALNRRDEILRFFE